MNNSILSYVIGKFMADYPSEFSPNRDGFFVCDILNYAAEIEPIFAIDTTYHAIVLSKCKDDAFSFISAQSLDIFIKNPEGALDRIKKFIDSNERYEWAVYQLFDYYDDSFILRSLLTKERFKHVTKHVRDW